MKQQLRYCTCIISDQVFISATPLSIWVWLSLVKIPALTPPGPNTARLLSALHADLLQKLHRLFRGRITIVSRWNERVAGLRELGT